MKKIGAILLTFCMLMSLVMVPTFAETQEPVVIDATTEVKSFYDNGMNGGNGKLEIFNENVMLRPCGEWVTYDISNLTAGTYSVSVLYKLNGNVVWKSTGLDFAVDGALESRAYISHTGAWADEAVEASVGKIYVPEGAAELKVKNHGIYSINLDTITLTYIGAEDTSEDILIYGQNVTSNPNSAKTGHEFYLGVDYWDVATGTTSDYTKEDENGLMHLPLTNSSTFQGTNLAQHAGDWTRYDISDFKAGTYEVTLKRAHYADATCNIKIDGKTALQTKMTKTTSESNFNTSEEIVLGKIYIKDGSEYLTLLNEGAGSIMVHYMKFKYISSERDEETIPSVKYNGTSVIPGGQGVGFYANSMNGNCPDSLETNNTQVVLRQAGEWVAYDVSNLEVGIYAFNLSYTVREETAFYLDVYVDDVLQAKIKPPKTTNSLGGAPDTIEACNVEITKESKVLKIRNSSQRVTNICAVELSYITDPQGSYKIRQYGDHATVRDVEGVMTYESGVDYYDAGGAGFVARLNNNYVSDVGDWARYDIKGMKPGTYKLTYNYSSKVATYKKFKIDGHVVITGNLPVTSTDYNTYADAVIGYVYIPEDAEYFIVENKSGGSVCSNYFEFEFISKNVTKPSISLNATDVIPGGQGVGYYDSTGEKLESSGTTVTIRPSEWVKYDVSELKTGTYSLTLNCCQTSNVELNVYIDDNLYIMNKAEKTGTSWTDATYEDSYLGSIYIGEDTETIMVKNAHASATTMVSKVILKNLSDEDKAVMRFTVPVTNVYKIDGEVIGASKADDKEASYYDAGGEGKLEVDNGVNPILREGDWVRFDISELELSPGIYNLYASINTNAASIAGVSAEGESVHNTTAITGKTSASDETLIGKFVVSEDTTYITVSCENYQRIILYSMIISDDVSKETTVAYTSDAEGKTSVSSLSGLEKVYVTVDMIRPEKASIGETVYVALYDGNKLNYVQVKPVTDGYRYTNTFEVTGLGDLSKVKTFIWETDKYIPVISIANTTIAAQ